MITIRHGQADILRRGASPLRVEPKRAPVWAAVGRVLRELPWKVMGSCVALGALLVGTGFGIREIALGVDRPITEIVVKGRFTALSYDDFHGHTAALIGQSFLSTDLEAVQQRVESDPWIDAAAVRRVWPSTLEIYGLEQVPAAYWNGASFLNQRIEVFTPDHAPTYPGLPKLFGPLGQEQRVFGIWEQAQRAMAGFGTTVTAVVLQPRGAWELQLADGARVQLGREDIEARFGRFLKVYPNVQDPAQVEYYDARYANGVAIRWREAESEGAGVNGQPSGTPSASRASK